MSRNIGLRGSFGGSYFQINTIHAKKLRGIAKWLISVQFAIVSFIHPLSVIVQESFKGHGRFGKQVRGLFPSEKSNI